MQLRITDGTLQFEPHFFSEQEAALLFEQLRAQVKWKEETITIFGKKVMQPRLVAWYGDAGKVYTYSGRTNTPEAWNEPLQLIKQRVEAHSHQAFNSCLCNLYRHGNDSMGWHSDDEPKLGNNPVIASVNLGATRTFKLQHKQDKAQKLSIELSNGSLLVMGGTLQHYWKHSVPKTARPVGERINLTFRYIL